MASEAVQLNDTRHTAPQIQVSLMVCLPASTSEHEMCLQIKTAFNFGMRGMVVFRCVNKGFEVC